MWYLFAELDGQPAQKFEDPNLPVLLGQKTVLEAGGWTCTLFDETERAAMADLTARLIEKHPHLAV